MRISVGWLRALGSVPASLDTQALAKLVTDLGLEVEAIDRFGEGIEPVLIVEVKSLRPHPSRASLRLVTIDRGNGVLQEVVCGASNVPAPGGLVLLAPIGTHLPAAAGGKGLTLTPREIGGVVSEGMLCSERELGLAFGGASGGAKTGGNADEGDDHGIIVLPVGFANAGTRFIDVVPEARDDVFEIGVTPNRPDALGHVGVARDVAARLAVPFSPPKPAPIARHLNVASSALASITIDAAAADRAPRYAAHVVEGVRVAPSPLSIRYRLHALGVRSLSNVVDVTNLVMLERGQPLHAFDLDRLAGRAIQVRTAREGEVIRTLDGQERKLSADDLVICDGGPDGGVPVAIAGVMGGGDSEITDATTRVLIEVAFFDARGVRRSSKRHGLHTEASHRFERGVDPSAVLEVVAAATSLVAELAGGAAATAPIDVVAKAIAPVTVSLRHARISALLGIDVTAEDAADALRRLGFVVGAWADGVCAVVAPLHRPDIQREVDLIEEIARLRGLDAIPAALPVIRPQPASGLGALERRAREVCRELGLSEAVSPAFASVAELAAIHAPPPAVHLQNPMGEERAVMRTSLLPGLFAGLRRSRRHGERRVRTFEVGARFLGWNNPVESTPEAAAGASICDEASSLAIVLAGPRDGWLTSGGDVDVWDAKGLAEELVTRLTGRAATTTQHDAASRPAHLHPRGAASLSVRANDDASVGDVVIGTFGPLHPDVIDAAALDGEAIVIELDLRAIARVDVHAPMFRALPTLPAATRDVALEVDEATTAGTLRARLHEGAGPLCASVEIFDVYRGKGVADGKKSIAFRLTFRDPHGERTLADKEIDAQLAAAIASAASAGAVLRG